jgi:hypothetical protein
VEILETTYMTGVQLMTISEFRLQEAGLSLAMENDGCEGNCSCGKSVVPETDDEHNEHRITH